VSGSGYNSSTYLMNFTSGDSAGVTGPYGDDFLDTNSAPINNMNMDLTFGASISSNTPAGLYTTSLSLIATGKF
jgi:Na+-transporting NADH:ubiquinone oxidoreductase subunit NqrF